MTDESLTAQDWIAILAGMAAGLEAGKDRLNQLDGVIGDGDHGVTMSIGFRAVRQALDALPPDVTIDQVFATAGKAFLNAAGGAIGPLIGTMWTDAARQMPACRAFSAAECKLMLPAMEKAIVRRGHAAPGDKTMLDAMHPAVVAGLASASEGLIAMLHNAAAAAENGARATAVMVARVGRSSRLGERTVGHEDAGANSLAIMLRSMAETAASRIPVALQK